MYSVEYSRNQKCFHTDDLNKTLSINMEKIVLNQENDWQIIGVFNTIEEADKFADTVKGSRIFNKIMQREDA